MARDIERQRERARAHMEVQQMASDMNQRRQEEKERLRNNFAELLARYATDGDENAVAWLNRIYGRMQVLSLAQLLQRLDVPTAFQIRAEILQMAVDEVEQLRRDRGVYLLRTGGWRTATPPGRLEERRNKRTFGLLYPQLPHDAYWYEDLDVGRDPDDDPSTFVRDFTFESPRPQNPMRSQEGWFSRAMRSLRGETSQLDMDGSVSPGSRSTAQVSRSREEAADTAEEESISPLSLAPPAWLNEERNQENARSGERMSPTPAARQTNWQDAGVSPPSPGLRLAFRRSQGMQDQTQPRSGDRETTFDNLHAHVLSTFNSIYGSSNIRRQASVVDATDVNARWIANQILLRNRLQRDEQRTTIVSSHPPSGRNAYPPLPTVDELVRENMHLFYRDGEVPEEVEFRRQTAPNVSAPNASAPQSRRRSSMIDTCLNLALRRSAQRQTHGPPRRRSSVPDDLQHVAARPRDSLSEAKRRMSRMAEALGGRLDSLT